MSDPEKPKVVKLCGTAYSPAEAGASTEADAAKVQLKHWAACTEQYVGLFVTEDAISFASSCEDPGRILQLVDLLQSRARAWSRQNLLGPYVEDDDDGDDAA